MKKVFISHPFSGDPALNRRLVDQICRRIIEQEENVLPISPLHAFSFIEIESPEVREEVMNWCEWQIKMLAEEGGNELRLFIYDLSRSSGQADENGFAIDYGLEVKYINGDLLDLECD